jgi:hypothetical protein
MSKYPEKQAIDRVTNYVAGNLKSTHSNLQDAIESLNDNLTDVASQLRRSARDALNSPMAKKAQVHPFAAAGIALLAGIVLARLTRR